MALSHAIRLQIFGFSRLSAAFQLETRRRYFPESGNKAAAAKAIISPKLDGTDKSVPRYESFLWD
jgi:hypothetical protein